MHTTFMFATGIECSSPTIDGGIRRDLLDECGHYTHWRAEFALVRDLGIGYLRYGVPLYRLWPGPDRYDWAFADASFGALRALGITPIADLCHFGLPDWLGNFQNPDFPAQFARFATAFATRYPWIQLYTPVNEIYTCARASALYGLWNEQLRSDAAFVCAIKHMVQASRAAMAAVLRVRPDAIFVQSESSEFFHASEPAAIERAEHLNARRFLSLDLCYGHRVDSTMYEYLLDNGMTRAEYHALLDQQFKTHCILGSDYYPQNEHRIDADGHLSSADGLYGFAMIAREYYERYRLPIMYTETNHDQGPEGTEAVDWLRKEWGHLLALTRSGVPMVGFTWYSLIDQIDWDVELAHCAGHVNPRGLADLDRQLRPVGHAYRALIQQWRGVPPAAGLPAQRAP